MNKLKIGYRINVDNFLTSKDEYDKFIDYYYSLFECAELKITSKVYESDFFKYIIFKFLRYDNYSNNFHINKRYLNDLNDYSKLFSVTDKSVNYITHLYDYYVNDDLINRIKKISCLIPNGCNLLLENPEISIDIFESIDRCNEFCIRLDELDINNIGLCLDFGHLLCILDSQKVDFDLFYDYLVKYKELLNRVREFHLHDYYDGLDHRLITVDSLNLLKFKKLYDVCSSGNVIILENDVSNDPLNIGIKQVNIIKEVLLNEDKRD